MKEFIEIPFGAKDSELCRWEYTIPEGFIASIENGKIIVKKEESEDEKIRKEIIHLVKKSNEYGGYALHKWEADEMLAWVEKQGQKDKLIQELGEYKVKYTQEILEKHINSMSKKDDERLRKTTIAFLKDFAEQGYENAVECIDWLEKQGEQKSIDFKAKDWYVSKVDGKIYNAKFMGKKQEEQKTAWSEEDEEMFDAIIADIQFTQKTHNHEVNQVVYEREIDWLKSLKDKVQPQWKPSEEQIDVLNMVITDEAMDDNVKTILKELIIQIKKL